MKLIARPHYRRGEMAAFFGGAATLRTTLATTRRTTLATTRRTTLATTRRTTITPTRRTPLATALRAALGVVFAVCLGVVLAVGVVFRATPAQAQEAGNLLVPYLPSSDADLWSFDKFHERQWTFCAEDGSEALDGDDNPRRMEYAYFSRMQSASQFKYCYNDNALQTFVIDPAEGFADGDMIVTLGYPQRPTSDGLIQYFYRLPLDISKSGQYTLSGAARLPQYTFPGTAYIQAGHDAVDLSHSIVFVAVKEEDEALAFEAEPLYEPYVKITGVTSGGEPRPFFAKWIYDNDEAEWWVDDADEDVPQGAHPFSATLSLTPDYRYLRIYAPKDGHAIPIHPVAVNALSLVPDIDNGVVSVASSGTAPRYYTLQGQRISNPGHGIYIKVSDRQASKIRR